MYKCSACGCEDKFVYGLLNTSFTEGPKRIYITYCEQCNSYYFYESFSKRIGGEPGQPIRKLELTRTEALELIVKMKCCSDPKDVECKCNIHKYINSFRLSNVHRMIAL
jgi:hypothetical protein